MLAERTRRSVFFRYHEELIVSQESVQRQAQAIDEWPGTCERLGQVQAPTLAMAGTADVVSPSGNALVLARLIPQAWLAFFGGGGHALIYQYPRQIAATILNFFQAPS